MASILKVRDADGTVHEIYSIQGKSAYEYAVDGGYTGTEAEFSAKLAAEKFSNPNALTFTGAVTGSYDGSEALTVDIPSGDGGSNLPIPTAEDVGKVPTVNADGTGYELETVSSGGSGETIIAEETVLASGTIATGTAANSFSTTGVTIGDLRKWKYFTVEIKSKGQSTYWAPADALRHNLSRIQHNNIKFQFEWIDSARTVLRVFYASGTGYEYGQNDIKGSIINSAVPVAHKQGEYSRVDVADDVILGIINYDALTVDALWRVKGVLKYGD